jgi:polyisoprenoid-binding protein YceI
MKTLLLTLLLTSQAFALDYSEGLYKLDSNHSKIGFEIPHLVISTVEGRFTQVEGTIQLASEFEKSKVEVGVNVASVDTGVAQRDEHLRSPDFFDAKKFPRMTFVSTEIKGKIESFELIGDLTIHGVTKRVSFNTRYLGIVANGYGYDVAAFIGQAKISRKEFGLTYNQTIEAGQVIGDEVTIDLRIQASRPSKKTSALFNHVEDLNR